jgi:hypothetical protein
VRLTRADDHLVLISLLDPFAAVLVADSLLANVDHLPGFLVVLLGSFLSEARRTERKQPQANEGELANSEA